jgi:serine/threonine-protein phosphatase PP1 catalytic subunit
MTSTSDEAGVFNIDDLINKVWGILKTPTQPNILTLSEIKYVIAAAKLIIQSQPVFLELVPPLVVCGDTHGQFFDLLRIFEQCGDPGFTNYLFLGDYVDRGSDSINTISLLLLYKIKYPENFFLLRGNHEAAQMNSMYGFYAECRAKDKEKLWKKFNDLFDWLPFSAMIDNRILCVHGGIGPELQSLDQLRQIKRPLKIPEKGLECDLTWADPEPDCDEFKESSRLTSYVFGEEPARRLLHELSLDVIFRAHQAIENGYNFPFEPWTGVLTIFSAPNYGGSFGNHGAVVSVSTDLKCRFVTFEPKDPVVVASLIKRPITPEKTLVDGPGQDDELAFRRFGHGKRSSVGL